MALVAEDAVAVSHMRGIIHDLSPLTHCASCIGGHGTVP